MLIREACLGISIALFEYIGLSQAESGEIVPRIGVPLGQHGYTLTHLEVISSQFKIFLEISSEDHTSRIIVGRRDVKLNAEKAKEDRHLL